MRKLFAAACAVFFCAKLVCADEKVYSLRTSNIPSTFNETLS